MANTVLRGAPTKVTELPELDSPDWIVSGREADGRYGKTPFSTIADASEAAVEAAATATDAADRAETAAAALEGVAFASAVSIELVAGQTDYPLAYDPGLDEMLVDFNGLTLKFTADYTVVYIATVPHIRLVEAPIYSHSASFPQLLTYRSAAAVPYDPNLNRLEGQKSRADLVTHIGGNGAVQGQQYQVPGLALWAPYVGHADYGYDVAPDLPGLAPSGEVLDIKMCGSSSDLANDFKGIMEQAAEDCLAKNWKLRVSKGPWETQPIVIDAAMDGLLHIDFAPGSTLIGPHNGQHFAGDGSTKVFTLNAWGSASTDGCSAAIVYADGSYTVLASGNATSGFVKSGTTITLGSAVSAPPVGATLTTAADAALFAVRGEGRNFGVRFRGGDFYNGDMAYVEQQGSGSCVYLQTLRDVYWDGAPVFRGHPDRTWDADILNKRGDSGLVLGNVERASIYGAQFLYQPDAGNYTTGLARGTPPEDYHIDDGRFIKFFGASAYYCGLGFRSARDGGAYGLYGCDTDLCFDGFLAANVSSGMPSARNIVIDGLTCRKTAANVLDLRAMQSVNVRNLMIEDWGRMPDGSEPATPFPMFNLGGGAGYMRIDARLRYEEWEPPATAAKFIEIANAPFRDTELDVSIELPHSAVGENHKALYASAALGTVGDVSAKLKLTNVDIPLDVPATSEVKAHVTKVTHNPGVSYSKSVYRQYKGIITPEPSGLYGFTDVGLGIGTITPTQPLHVIGTARVERSGNTSQAVSVSSDVFNSVMSTSAPATAKTLRISSTTDGSNTTPTSGEVGIEFLTLGQVRAKISQDGYFGVNTTSPAQPLHVAGESRFERPGVTGQAVQISPGVSQRITGYSDPATAKPLLINVTTDDAGTAPTNGSISIDFATMGLTRARVTQAGDMGIGPAAMTPTARLHVDGPIRHTTSTVAALPAAGTVGAGTRSMVTDANATTFNSIVAGGGANIVPVFSDGTNWRIG